MYERGEWLVNFEIIVDSVASIAGLIGSLTAIGGFLIFIYTKAIGNPLEKRKVEREEEYQRQWRETLEKNNKPIIEALSIMKKSDQKHVDFTDKLEEIAIQNSKIIKNHEQKINSHNERLIVLEVKNGIHKDVKYVEKYVGGDSNGTAT